LFHSILVTHHCNDNALATRQFLITYHQGSDLTDDSNYIFADRGSLTMTPAPSVSWTTGERLVVSDGADPSREISSWAPQPPFLKLFFQGHLTFMTTGAPLERSRSYRAALIDCMNGLEPGSQYAQNLQEAHCVWSFMEAVYLVDPACDSTHVSSRLADWYFVNFPELQEQARAYLNTDSDPVDDNEEDDYWSLIARLVAVGARSMAGRLLAKRLARDGFGNDWASAAGAAVLQVADGGGEHHSPLAIADALLAECPANTDASYAGRVDGAWSAWQNLCDSWANEQTEDQEHRLVRVLKILAGNTRYMASACATWEEMMVATVTYSSRIMSGNLHDHGIVDVENACAEASSLFELPKLIAGGALMEAAVGRPAEAIVRLGASLESTWYAAHLCDLLMQTKHIAVDSVSNWMPAPGGVSLLEYLTLQFVRKLEENRGMWRIAADYYTQCPRKGPKALREMLLRVTFDGPVDPCIEKIMLFCDTHNMADVKVQICARVGSECAHARNFGGAMLWFSRGNLADRVVSLVECAVSDAELGGPGSSNSRMLDHVVCAATVGGASDGIKERVAYAREFVSFQNSISLAKTLSEGDDTLALSAAVHESQRLAIRLVRGGGLPRRFWPILIYEICNMANRVPSFASKLSTDAVYELVSALEVISSTPRPCGEIDNLLVRLRCQTDSASERNATELGQMELGSFVSVQDALDSMRSTLLKAITTSFCAGVG
jgi:Nup85 Nucleoporin